jgi:hypothetical protein
LESAYAPRRQGAGRVGRQGGIIAIDQAARKAGLERLDPFVGEWSFTGTFCDDGSAIQGRGETSNDGSTWEHDFDLTYSKVR